jgi:arabinose-5-phosphate isomerase
MSDLITYAKRFGIAIIAIGAHPDSTLVKAADVRLLLPHAPEACPMGLAPTTSTTMMLSLGDALAVALMERKGFSADQYRDFHPGGSLGRALIRVSDLMHGENEIPLAREKDAMRDVLITMASGMLGCVGILDANGNLAGIVTDGDVRRHAGGGIENRKAEEIMTRAPKIARPGQLAAEALALMTEKKITQLFVVDEGDLKPLGVIHIHDCLRAGIA